MDNLQVLKGEAPQSLEYCADFASRLPFSLSDLEAEALSGALSTEISANGMVSRFFNDHEAKSGAANPLSENMKLLLHAVAELNYGTRPNSIYAIEYQPGVGFPFHTDNKRFTIGDIFYGLTIGGERVMRFRGKGHRSKLLLEDGSLYAILNAAATELQHGFLVDWNSPKRTQNWHKEYKFLKREEFDGREISQQKVLALVMHSYF